MTTPTRSFLLLLSFSACAQYDSGAIAALEDYMKSKLGLSTSKIGVINATEYAVLPFISPILAILFRRRSPKIVLLMCVIGNLLGVLGFCLAPSIQNRDVGIAMILCRVLSGCSHAGISIYGNVWVDYFAPEGSTASWMGAMQASSLIGLVIGYSIGGFTADWRLTMSLNMAWFLLIFAGILSTKKEFLDVGERAIETQTGDTSAQDAVSFIGSFAQSTSARDVQEGNALLAEVGSKTSAVVSIVLYSAISFSVACLFFRIGRVAVLGQALYVAIVHWWGRKPKS